MFMFHANNLFSDDLIIWELVDDMPVMWHKAANAAPQTVTYLPPWQELTTPPGYSLYKVRNYGIHGYISIDGTVFSKADTNYQTTATTRTTTIPWGANSSILA